jgi:hypothetical protein
MPLLPLGALGHVAADHGVELGALDACLPVELEVDGDRGDGLGDGLGDVEAAANKSLRTVGASHYRTARHNPPGFLRSRIQPRPKQKSRARK